MNFVTIAIECSSQVKYVTRARWRRLSALRPQERVLLVHIGAGQHRNALAQAKVVVYGVLDQLPFPVLRYVVLPIVEAYVVAKAIDLFVETVGIAGVARIAVGQSAGLDLTEVAAGIHRFGNLR